MDAGVDCDVDGACAGGAATVENAMTIAV